MVYFTKNSFEFLTDLEKNNDREWFNANKKRFIEDLKDPFEKFIADLIEAMTPFFDSMPIAPKDAIFRIYRDVRFSKNKLPYKTRVSALVNPGGRKEMTRPGLYIEISAREIGIYSGLYMLDTQQLRNVRSHISHNLDLFDRLITNPSFKKTFGEVRGEQNKRIPKEFEEDLKEQPLLLNKQFYYFTTLPAASALQNGFIKEVVDTYKVAQPLSEFLYEGIF